MSPSAEFQMSDTSARWDKAEKGFLTDAERTAKNLDVDGKGYLSREQSVKFASQFHDLKEDNKQIKKQVYGLAFLCVLLFIGTITGTVMAIKNSKDTVVDMKTGVMKVNDGAGGEAVVTVQAQGTTFQTTGNSVEMNEETLTTDPTTGETTTDTQVVIGHCVSVEDIANMWLANEQGIDARLIILDNNVNDDTVISSIEPVTTGRASWMNDHIVMGGMTFTPNEECTDFEHRRRMLNIDMQSPFDSISIHRALKQRVDFLSGRDFSDNGRMLPSASSVEYPGDEKQNTGLYAAAAAS
jgi:hypothetical protein